MELDYLAFDVLSAAQNGLVVNWPTKMGLAVPALQVIRPRRLV